MDNRQSLQIILIHIFDLYKNLYSSSVPTSRILSLPDYQKAHPYPTSKIRVVGTVNREYLGVVK